MPERSPKILRSSWGEMEIESVGAGKDFKLWPGGARAWDWHETGTNHEDGIQPADVEELLEHGATTVVLSRGRELRLRTAQATLDLLRDRRVTVHVDATPAAIDRYNDLAGQGDAVGGLFHSTC
jgi:hypothetical protein